MQQVSLLCTKGKHVSHYNEKFKYPVFQSYFLKLYFWFYFSFQLNENLNFGVSLFCKLITVNRYCSWLWRQYSDTWPNHQFLLLNFRKGFGGLVRELCIVNDRVCFRRTSIPNFKRARSFLATLKWCDSECRVAQVSTVSNFIQEIEENPDIWLPCDCIFLAQWSLNVLIIWGDIQGHMAFISLWFDVWSHCVW